MSGTKTDSGSTAAYTLTQELYGFVHFRVGAAIRAAKGVRDVRVHARSVNRHVLQVELEDGTIRNFTVQIIEHR